MTDQSPAPSPKPKGHRQTQAQLARVITAAAAAGRILSEALAQPDGSVRLVFRGEPDPKQPVIDRQPPRADQRTPGEW